MKRSPTQKAPSSTGKGAISNNGGDSPNASLKKGQTAGGQKSQGAASRGASPDRQQTAKSKRSAAPIGQQDDDDDRSHIIGTPPGVNRSPTRASNASPNRQSQGRQSKVATEMAGLQQQSDEQTQRVLNQSKTGGAVSKLDSNAADAQNLENAAEQQETADDFDLKEIKQKLNQMKQMEQPQSKDEMISYLLKRLQEAEQAIGMCEQIINKERGYRKDANAELKKKNAELRQQIKQEKENLAQKIQKHMEKTLETAVKDRIETEAQLKDKTSQCEQLEKELEELRFQHSKLQEKYSKQTEETNEKTEKIRNLQLDLTESNNARDKLIKDNLFCHETSEKAIELRSEAVAAIVKMDECRVVLNRLMGPQGALSANERQKFLPYKGQGDFEIGAISAIGGGDPRNRGTKNYQQNKKYLPPLGGQATLDRNSSARLRNGSTLDAGNINNQGGGSVIAPNDVGEDEFWYQTPKGGGGYGQY